MPCKYYKAPHDQVSMYMYILSREPGLDGIIRPGDELFILEKPDDDITPLIFLVLRPTGASSSQSFNLICCPDSVFFQVSKTWHKWKYPEQSDPGSTISVAALQYSLDDAMDDLKLWLDKKRYRSGSIDSIHFLDLPKDPGRDICKLIESSNNTSAAGKFLCIFASSNSLKEVGITPPLLTTGPSSISDNITLDSSPPHPLKSNKPASQELPPLVGGLIAVWRSPAYVPKRSCDVEHVGVGDSSWKADVDRSPGVFAGWEKGKPITKEMIKRATLLCAEDFVGVALYDELLAIELPAMKREDFEALLSRTKWYKHADWDVRYHNGPISKDKKIEDLVGMLKRWGYWRYWTRKELCEN
ncbi:hypothetical protein QBC38DRAFT_500029 [Podospora fimiseda]|uniref:Uncharacterized protein n=1 Tax=Podospora fimiseda TaxID=252190 RepID=A0AAN7GTQ0_9PEZI|nr:hypothetical protein QBC38DRAFT_500029 [Podospora fimiseda]